MVDLCAWVSLFVSISLMVGCVCGYLGLECSVFVINSVVGCDSFLLCWVWVCLFLLVRLF